MARLRLPLYTKTLLWFFVNLALLGLLGYGFLRMQFRLGFDWLLEGPAGERMETVAEVITGELKGLPEGTWNEVLLRYSTAYRVNFALFRNDATQSGGEPVSPPAQVASLLVDKRIAREEPPPRERRGEQAPSPPRGGPAQAQPPRPRFMIRTSDPTLYWVGIHLGLAQGSGADRRPVTLVLTSDRLTGRGLFFDPWPWIGIGFGAVVLSSLVWLPLIGGMTRTIRRMNDAAKSISQGKFEVRVPEHRQDELGELASSVNVMASQLGEYVQQQRRITRDVAHELCSPIARMQMALGVIEQRARPDQSKYLLKVDAELQHMARLVEEVLAFSKSEALPEQETPTEFNLRELVRSVVVREAGGCELQVAVPPGLELVTLRSALDRALGNVVGNAVRYAGKVGPVEIVVERQNSRQIRVRVLDCGPGVPEEALPHLFEPFYRPSTNRARHNGGSGLGLAIVKRGVEACGGSVTARLREQGGLEIEMLLPQEMSVPAGLQVA